MCLGSSRDRFLLGIAFFHFVSIINYFGNFLVVVKRKDSKNKMGNTKLNHMNLTFIIKIVN